jgi:Methyltransferase domain
MFALELAATEFRASAGARGAALGGVAATALRAAGIDTQVAIAVGVVAAALEFSAVERHNRRMREVRNAAERVSVTSYAEQPLFFGEGAIDADFARVLLDTINRTSGDIVELGAGVSTALAAQAIRGSGRRVYSIEHDEAWADLCRRRLEGAGLQEAVTLIRAPLREQSFDGYRTRWYDRRSLDGIPAGIGALIVDGPPYARGKERWPAVEVLRDRLAPDAVILADDGRRRDEMRMARRWADLTGLTLRYVDTSKGAWMLTRETNPRLSGPLLRLARRLNPRPAGHGLAAIPR